MLPSTANTGAKVSSSSSRSAVTTSPACRITSARRRSGYIAAGRSGARRRPLAPDVGVGHHDDAHAASLPAAAGRAQRPTGRGSEAAGLCNPASGPNGPSWEVGHDTGDCGRRAGIRSIGTVDRRSLLKGMAALGAGAGLAACGFRPGDAGWGNGHGHGPPWGRVLPPGSRPFPRVPEGTDMLPRDRARRRADDGEPLVRLVLRCVAPRRRLPLRARRQAAQREPRRPRQLRARVPHAVDVPAPRAARARTGTAATGRGTTVATTASSLASTAVSMGYWDQTDMPVLLRAREHVPARPTAGSARCSRRRIPNRRFLMAGTASGNVSTSNASLTVVPATERDDLRPLPGARDLVAELLHRPAVGRDHLQDPARTTRRTSRRSASSTPTRPRARCRSSASSTRTSTPSPRRTRRTSGAASRWRRR